MSKRYTLALFSLLLLFAACQKSPFTQSGMAEDHFYLRSGSQTLPVLVAGNMDSDKMLVIVHGGPGGDGIVYRDGFTQRLIEPTLPVVYWSQRFAGGSSGTGGSSDIEQFREDMRNLLLLLRSQYGEGRKIFLMGHSWGGFLVPYFLIEESNAALVAGWIQVGGAHNYRLNDSLTREMLLFYAEEEINAARNTDFWQEVRGWCSTHGFESAEDSYQLNTYAHEAENLMPDLTFPEEGFTSEAAPVVVHWLNNYASALRDIDAAAYATPISENLYRIETPTLLLWGKYDFVCPSPLMFDIVERIGSSDLQTQIFAQSGHSPMFNQPDEFWQTVTDWLSRH